MQDCNLGYGRAKYPLSKTEFALFHMDCSAIINKVRCDKFNNSRYRSEITFENSMEIPMLAPLTQLFKLCGQSLGIKMGSPYIMLRPQSPTNYWHFDERALSMTLSLDSPSNWHKKFGTRIVSRQETAKLLINIKMSAQKMSTKF